MRVAAEARAARSPEQISGWLKREFPTRPRMPYLTKRSIGSLFVQTACVLKRADGALAHQTSMRLPKSHNADSGRTHPRYGLIRERPPRPRDRAVPAIGKVTFLPERRYAHRHTYERTSALPCWSASSQYTTTVVAALAKHVANCLRSWRRSLTW